MFDMNLKFSQVLSSVLDLCKVRITLAVSLTTIIGYILAKGKLDLGCVLPTIGVFILSSGSSAINQWQEIKFDALMDRTKNRPLVKEVFTSFQGFNIGALLIFIGLFVLVTFSTLEAFYLGVAAVLWYNAIYTPMKRISSLAAIPGALIGSIPPAIGWAATGTSMMDLNLWWLAAFIFIWQIPHFWILLLIYHDDYKKADYPILTDLLNNSQLKRVTYMWIVILAFSSIGLVLLNQYKSVYLVVSVFLMSVFICYRAIRILKEDLSKSDYKIIFRDINSYVLLVLLFLTIDRLF